MVRRLTTIEFIQKAIDVHGILYDYASVVYRRAKDKVVINCKTHGPFIQSPNDHLNGCGCPPCGSKTAHDVTRKSTEDFIARAIRIHGLVYDYSEVDYFNTTKKVDIVCKKHGVFKQSPVDHLAGKGCIRCANTGAVSKLEDKWISEVNDSVVRHLKIKIENKTYVPDGYDPVTNTIYEFFGDYWHGNPKRFRLTDRNRHNNKTFRDLHEQTMSKVKMYEDNGYKVIWIWEGDYQAQIKEKDFGRI